MSEIAPDGTQDERSVCFRTRGMPAGPVVRLVSPHDLGEILKPFVFVDLADIAPEPEGVFRWHPHSGIATLTIIHEGMTEYRETTGVSGRLGPGAIEYMISGRGVWHTASPIGKDRLKGYQIWLLLPPGPDLQQPASTYLADEDVPREKGLRVILGEWSGLKSALAAPPDTTLLDLTLERNEGWAFVPPDGQEVCWLAVHSGTIQCGGSLAHAGELLVFEDGATPVHVRSIVRAGFIIGSAKWAVYPLHTGSHSVHVSAEALKQGEAEIIRLRSTVPSPRFVR